MGGVRAHATQIKKNKKRKTQLKNKKKTEIFTSSQGTPDMTIIFHYTKKSKISKNNLYIIKGTRH